MTQFPPSGLAVGREGTGTGPRGTRFPLVDSMRGLAALSVVVFHVSFAFRQTGSSLWEYVTQRNAGLPVTAVVIFFLISGFVLYRPFAEARFRGEAMPPLMPYAIRRVARIVPAYWVALAVVGVLLSLDYLFAPGGLIRYFGFLQLYSNLRVAQGGIGPAWTLCIEITFYAALPLLALVIRRLGRGRSFLRSELSLCAVLALAAIAWQGLIFAIVSPSNGWILPLLNILPGSLDLFAGGMALAVVSVALEHRERAPRWVGVVDRAPWLCWALALAVFYAVGRTPTLERHGPAAWYMTAHDLKALGAGLLLLPLVFGAPRRGLLRRALGSAPLIWLGTISYGIYLWHQPLLYKLRPRLVPHGELFTGLALAAVTIAVAALSYYLVERPAQNLARRYLGARARRTAVQASPPVAIPRAGASAAAAASLPGEPRP